MSLRDLLLLYGLIGVASAIFVGMRASGSRASVISSALLSIPLWPVWAPFALSSPVRASRAVRSAAATRIDGALAAAVDAVAGSPIADVFTPKAAARIAEEVAHVVTRQAELVTLGAKAGFDVATSRQRLRDLESRGAPERLIATARMQLESLLRLEELRRADERALEELAELLEALRTQLVLARYAGSSAEGVSAMVGEVWARLEGLGAAFDDAATTARPEEGPEVQG
jgi:hypothetical protein